MPTPPDAQGPSTADASGQHRPPPPVVLLNHFYIVPDTATFEAMAASEFLRQEFAPGETRTTVRADASYTGLYLYGIHTYCEFLDARRDRRLVPGASGLALGVDRIHDLGVAAAGAPAEFPDPPP